jgi:hypothetical protein
MTEVAINLPSGTVVDRQLLNKIKSEDLAGVMADIYADPKRNVIVVDNVKQFFSAKNLIAALDACAPELSLILEHRGVALSDEDLGTVRQFAEIKQRVLYSLAASAPPPPHYSFADVPADWSVATHVTFGKNFIRRTRGDISYRATPNTVRRLWNFAAAYWAEGKRHRATMGLMSYNGYHKSAEVHGNYVQIGCQRFERYELEQVALHMEWDFPTPSAEVE